MNERQVAKNKQAKKKEITGGGEDGEATLG